MSQKTIVSQETIANIDVRIPIGMMFTMTGVILFAFGLSTRDNAAFYARSLGIDANLWWGLVLLVFGIAMLIFGRRNQMRLSTEVQKKAKSK